MTRAFQIGGLLLLAVVSGLCQQKANTKPPKAAPSPGPAVARPNNPRPNAQLNNPQRNNAGQNIPNPAARPLQRMMAMTPEQRERILEKLPPQQQANVRQRLESFDKLPPAEKARRLQLLQGFSDLPPEKQRILEKQLPAYNALPPEKKEILGFRGIQQLARMSDSERQARLNSEEMKSKFSPAELKMISDIAENYPFPGKQPPK